MDPGRADEAVTTEGAPHRHRAGRTRRWVELVAVQLHPATCPVCVTPSLALNSNLEQIAYMPGVVEARHGPIARARRPPGVAVAWSWSRRMGMERDTVPVPPKRNVWKSKERDARRPPGDGNGMGDGGGASQPEGTGGARDATSRAVAYSRAPGWVSQESDVGAARTREEIGGTGTWFTIPLGNRREPDFFPVPGTGRDLVPGGFSGKPVSKF